MESTVLDNEFKTIGPRKTRRTFTVAQKKAVANEQGHTNHVAQKYGVHISMVSRWRKEYRKSTDLKNHVKKSVGKIVDYTAETARLTRMSARNNALERELADARIDIIALREIIKRNDMVSK